MEIGKKMALLVGCNYPNTPHELHGCHNDVLAMREILITRFKFDPKFIELLIDKPKNSIMPTGANIKNALTKMIDRAEKGDTLFFHYSGHGTLINKNSSKKEEAIVPCDFNLITSADFRQLVNRVPKGATFTILSDSCHSGGLIDKETEQIGPCGAFSNAVQMVLKENPGPLSNRQIVILARKILMMQHFNNQHPCLYCSDENADEMFLTPPQKPCA